MGREGQERQARQAAHPVQARPYAQAARDRVGPHRFGGARPRLQALAVRRGVLTLFAARAKPEQPPDSGTSRLVLGPGILALQQKRPRRRRARRRVTGNPAQGSVSLARRDRVRTRPIDSRLFPSGGRAHLRCRRTRPRTRGACTVGTTAGARAYACPRRAMTIKRRNRINGQWSPRLIEMLEAPAYRALSLSAHRVISRIEIELSSHGGNDNGRLPVTKLDFME